MTSYLLSLDIYFETSSAAEVFEVASAVSPDKALSFATTSTGDAVTREEHEEKSSNAAWPALLRKAS